MNNEPQTRMDTGNARIGQQAAGATTKLRIDLPPDLADWLEDAWPRHASSKSAYVRGLLEAERERDAEREREMEGANS